MDKIEKTRELLESLGLPKKQQADICVLTILGMANLKKTTKWTDATNEWMRIHDIIQFANKSYDVNYAENSRETFRKQALHHFRTAAIVEDNAKATNSPNYRWRLTSEFVEILRNINISDEPLETFKQNHESLIDIYASKKQMKKMLVKINGEDFTFSPGKHNQLQKAIIEEFATRFAPNSECLYVGDTIQKDLVKREERLKELGFKITLHDKMPDIVLYRADKNWLYFIEAVTSVGPMDPKRIQEITAMTQHVTAGKIFVTAFLDFKTYKKFSVELAWETEVWIAELPDHMIHLNGDKFLGPREKQST
ncbi:MAG: restriction endonuclease [Bacteroidaceae bacterium]|nr:restriction endonuclease [Bacteroidaceae bacterium]